LASGLFPSLVFAPHPRIIEEVLWAGGFAPQPTKPLKKQGGFVPKSSEKEIALNWPGHFILALSTLITLRQAQILKVLVRSAGVSDFDAIKIRDTSTSHQHF
jgi:hypothetical protein